jgi:hypothetical protein
LLVPRLADYLVVNLVGSLALRLAASWVAMSVDPRALSWVGCWAVCSVARKVDMKVGWTADARAVH